MLQFLPTPVLASTPGMQVKVGTYTGNGTDDHSITGIGFQPDFVLIKGDNASPAVVITDTFTGNKSKQITTGAGSTVTDGVKTLDADGFTLGTGANGNTADTTYWYIAVKDNGENTFNTGSYSGDGIDDRDITGVGFQPDFVVVMRDGDSQAVLRTSGHTGDSSQVFNGIDNTNIIQGFNADGFQVGTSGAVNANGGTYHYVAVKEETNVFQLLSYTGNGIDDRSITGAGFQPDFALVKAENTSNTGALRFKDNVGDSAPAVNGANSANRIQAFESDGFQIGTHAIVNTDTVPYNAVVWKNTTPPTITSVSDSPDPVAAGNDVTFSVDWNDTDSGEQVKIHLCKTNAITTQTCDGGSWANSSAFTTTDPEELTYTTSSEDEGTNTYYAFVCDDSNDCSSSTSGTFTVDATAPSSVDLDSPGDNGYTNNDRPTLKWKAATGLSKYVLEIDNGETNDFTINDIPISRTTDIETNKYYIRYENFSDSDTTNNYISVYTKSSSEWASDTKTGENDGKLKEGKRTWKIKAIDNVGNETTSSRTLFIDRTSPKTEFTQINDIQFSTSSNNNFSTTDKTPTIFGKLTDVLSSGDSSSSPQNDNGPKVASGPKQVEIKLEKKNAFGEYELHTLSTLNLTESYFTSDNSKITDNSKQTSGKYSPFEFIPKEDLTLGIYKVTITGKDNVDNSSSSISFTLNISTLARIITPEEKQIIEEEIEEFKEESQEKIKEELEITKPTERMPPPSAIEKTGENITQTTSSITSTVKQFLATIFTGIGKGIANLAFNIGEKTQGISTSVGTAIIKFGYLFVPNEPTRIHNVKVAKSTPKSMTITWTTNHPANSKVNYGLTADYGQDVQSDKRVTNHELTVTGLKPNTTYHYEVMSHNKNYVYDANHIFKTPAK